MLRRSLLAAATVVLLVLAWAVFSAYTASEDFVRADREAIVLAGRQAPALARQTCEKMSRFSHVDGLTDGNFMLPGFLGSSYYYRSMCLQTLAISSGDAKLCARVVRRFTPLGRDAGVSQASCEAGVARAVAARLEGERRAAAHARAIAGMAKIRETTVKRLGPDSWLVSLLASGERAGEYEFALTVPRRKFSETETLGLIYREIAYIGAGESRRYWTITRDQLFKALDPGVPPGGVYNLAVAMTWLKAAEGGAPAERVSAGIGNANIDDR